ncbi:hypothetical protein ACJJID_19445 [Microbulbifer sp. CnH-101-G]|uniref:hypothetical protein n=1 Tax=Microbulbifer sp. CnH-101-G TaxID=3243393 RepID=UPI00403A49B0
MTQTYVPLFGAPQNPFSRLVLNSGEVLAIIQSNISQDRLLTLTICHRIGLKAYSGPVEISLNGVKGEAFSLDTLSNQCDIFNVEDILHYALLNLKNLTSDEKKFLETPLDYLRKLELTHIPKFIQILRKFNPDQFNWGF